MTTYWLNGENPAVENPAAEVTDENTKKILHQPIPDQAHTPSIVREFVNPEVTVSASSPLPTSTLKIENERKENQVSETEETTPLLSTTNTVAGNGSVTHPL